MRGAKPGHAEQKFVLGRHTNRRTGLHKRHNTPYCMYPLAVAGHAAARMSRLGPLPPITVSMDVKPEAAAPSRSAEQQADLDFELDALHQSLGVKRGDALKEALKPKLECPMPPIELATPPIGEGISCHAPVVPAAQTNTEPAEDALR